VYRAAGSARRRELGGGRDTRPDAAGGLHLTVKEIEALRDEIERIDSRIIELVAQRELISEEIGLVKCKDGVQVRDRAREKLVKKAFTERARSEGSDAAFAETLAELLISHSVKVQLKRRPGNLRGRTALVVGGSGRMGAWFCRRFSCEGAKVQVWDPRGTNDGYDNIEDLTSAAERASIVVISSPLGVCREELQMVLDARPEGLVFDVCSVKAHIADLLRKGAKSGLKVTSVHPMFGPNVATPKGRNVIVCDCGSSEANEETTELFTGSGAQVARTTLERHDKLMAYVLGLSHASTIVFAATLHASGTTLGELMAVKGPSFERMVDMAKELSHESVRVYHDIQALNPNTRRMFEDIDETMTKLREAAEGKKSEKFRRIIESNRRYLEVK
jgi:chorismate mutase/prephenate dehydrogenase